MHDRSMIINGSTQKASKVYNSPHLRYNHFGLSVGSQPIVRAECKSNSFEYAEAMPIDGGAPVATTPYKTVIQVSIMRLQGCGALCRSHKFPAFPTFPPFPEFPAFPEFPTFPLFPAFHTFHAIPNHEVLDGVSSMSRSIERCAISKPPSIFHRASPVRGNSLAYSK